MQEKRLYAILSSSDVLRRLALGAAGLLALGAGAADGFTLVAPGTRARVLVGGNAVFGARDRACAIDEMRQAGRRGLANWA